MSMVSQIHHEWTVHGKLKPAKVVFFYSTKVDDEKVDPSKIPFLDRLHQFENDQVEKLSITLFVTGKYDELGDPEELGWHITRRIANEDLLRALGEIEQRKRTVCYVCGPAAMTDGFVEYLSGLDGLEPSRVFCEKWW